MEEAVASSESLVDPDAVNITREFIDFTEFLPADMYRSLQLVRQLKKKADDHSKNVDLLCKEFASLPEQSRVLPPNLDVSLRDYACPPMSERETDLRIRISNAIKGAQFAHREARAEAERASQNVQTNINRHHARIVAIYGGLCKVIIPPDEPEQRPAERQQTDFRKIKIRISSQKATPAGRHPRLRGSASIAQASRSRQKQRERSNRDDDGDDNEWEDIPSTPYNYEKIKKKKKLLGGISRRGPKNNCESPFVGGAKARNEDGSLIPNSLLPWNRLTNEELAKLRKRMKKNSGWTPSVTMIIRELETLGRGPKHKEKYEDQWGGRRGDEFLKIYGPEDGGIGDPEKIAPDDGAGVRENKGMKLNRAKKRKREEERKEKEKELEREKLEAKIEEERLRLALELEVRMKKEIQEEKERAELAKREREKAKAEEEAAIAAAAASAKEKREKEKAAMEEKAKASAALKEQERAAAAAAAASEPRVPQPITRSSSFSSPGSSSTSPASTSTGGDEDSEMPDAVSEERTASPPIPPPPPPKPRLGRPPKNPKPSIPSSSDSPPSSGEKRKRALSTVMTVLPTPSLAESRTKRGTSAAAPPTGTVSLAVGRKRSNVTGPKPNKPAKPGVGRKKGLVAGNSRRRVDVQDADGAEEWVDEEDEDSKTYCLCDEVSHGFMVLCDNEQCSKKWFHIDCVGLTEQVAKDSSSKWFCPECEGKRGKRRKKT
ncbi:unnamed protein product [Tuber aestivum]|uniref:PHD-type domain-containing protein n=1 Tax=Tuber aestivum TaxID=59557 RepID=A0A292PUB4_9PEZI|nr:unnamed protein product [Tuber aestivum]